jgi:UDP-galactopyranose mutase
MPPSKAISARPYDYLIVGAGFSGTVLAERIASIMGKRVLLIDRRLHIGGNAFDYYDDSGILVHKYGAHIFHTNSTEVVKHLSQFTQWRSYEHRVLASVDGQLLPIPINLTTINKLYGLQLDPSGMREFLNKRAVSIPTIRTSEENSSESNWVGVV